MSLGGLPLDVHSRGNKTAYERWQGHMTISFSSLYKYSKYGSTYDEIDDISLLILYSKTVPNDSSDKILLWLEVYRFSFGQQF